MNTLVWFTSDDEPHLAAAANFMGTVKMNCIR